MKPLSLFLAFASLAFAQNPPVLKPGLYAIFSTSDGPITALLYEKYTPVTVADFVALAQGTKPWLDPKTHKFVRRPLYDNLTFHRVLRDQAIQSGDPTGTSAHNCGIRIRDEFLPGLRFSAPGRLAMANNGQADSGGCQFFITNEAVPEWDGKYTIFGEVVAGQDVVNKISKGPLHGDKPIDPVKLTGVTIERVESSKHK